MTAGEVCNRNVVIAKADASLVDAARLMKAYHVGDVVVVDQRDERRVPTGILTDRDIALALADRPGGLPSLLVRDVMTRDLVTSTEDENLYDAVKKMQASGIRRLPIVNAAGGLEGILTFDDVVELLSEELADLAKLVTREQKREQQLRP